MTTTIPTIKNTILETTTDAIVHTIHEMSDGNFSATVESIAADGLRHYQGGTYKRTEAEARQYLADFTL